MKHWHQTAAILILFTAKAFPAETRLKELGSRPSLLNPLWYCGSFTIGVLAMAMILVASAILAVAEFVREQYGEDDRAPAHILGRRPFSDRRRVGKPPASIPAMPASPPKPATGSCSAGSR